MAPGVEFAEQRNKCGKTAAASGSHNDFIKNMDDIEHDIFGEGILHSMSNLLIALVGSNIRFHCFVLHVRSDFETTISIASLVSFRFNLALGR